MKKAALIIIPILVIIILVGFFFLKNRSSGGPSATPAPANTSNFDLPENQEQGVDVSLEPRFDNKAVILKVSKYTNTTVSIEYEMSYETKAGLPRGVLGKIDTKNLPSVIKEITLGTCSKNVCVYDEGVKKLP